MKIIPAIGGIDYDNSPVNVVTGDGKIRKNIEMSSDGVAYTVDDVTKFQNSSNIQFIVSDGIDTYMLEKTNSTNYTLKKEGNNGAWDTIGDIPVSSGIINDATKIDVKASNGKIFIVEPECEPVYIDVKNMYYGQGYTMYMSNRLYSDTNVLSVGDIVHIVGNVEDIANPDVYLGYAEIKLYLQYGGVHNYHILSPILIEYEIPSNPTEVTVYIANKIKQPPHKDYVKLIRPVPFLHPEVLMFEDNKIKYNNFLNKLYSYAYTYIYWDDYESPLSPMTTPVLDSYEGYMGNEFKNAARIKVKSISGVKKIRLYCKDNYSGDWVMIKEQDAKAETLFTFYGIATGTVLDNTLVKYAENIPYSVKGLYLDYNRLILYNYKTQNIDYTPNIESEISVESEISNINRGKYINYNLTGNITVHLGVRDKIDFSSIGYNFTNGAGLVVVNFRVDYTVKLYDELTHDYILIDDYVEFNIEFYFSHNTKNEIRNEIITRANNNYSTGSSHFNSITFSQTDDYIEFIKNYDLIETEVFNEQHSISLKVYPNTSNIVRHTLKGGEKYEFAVGISDTYGRLCGFKKLGVVNVEENSTNDNIYTYYPKIKVNINNLILENKYIQYFVRRNTTDKRQFVIRGKALSGTETVIKYENGYIYVDLNDLLQRDENNISYIFKEGDLIRFNSYYTTDKKRHLVPSTDTGGMVYRIDGIIVDSTNNKEYVKVRYPSGGNYLPTTINDNNVNYLIFEVIRGEGQENILWQSIGERYPLNIYNNKDIIINWGDYIIRPYSSIYSIILEHVVIIESKTISERFDSPMTFNPERAIVPFEIDTEWRNGLFYSRPYIENTKTNGYLQFDYNAFVDISSNYGRIVTLAKQGKLLFIFMETGMAVANIDTMEAKTPDGQTSVYSYSYIGQIEYDNSISLRNKYCLAISPENIYVIDGAENSLKIVSKNGIFDVSGEQAHPNGIHYGKFKKLIPDTQMLCYNNEKKRLYLFQENGDVYVYNDTLNRLESINGELEYSNNLRALYVNNKNNGVCMYVYVPNTSEYSKVKNKTQINVESEYSTFLSSGEDADFLSVVVYTEKKPISVKCIAYGDGKVIYTYIPISHFVRYSNGWRADIPKGNTSEDVKSYMLYEGYDLVGRALEVKVTFTGEYYGLGVRYVKRKY